MATAIYQRASDIKQDLDGVSIEMQEETINRFIEYKQFTNVKVYTEIKSARTIEGRNELKRLIKDIEKGMIKRVVIYKLDRLTRSLRDLMNLLHLFEEHDVELHSTHENIDTSTPSGRMLVQVLGIIAEWESANTSIRVSESMQLKASQGIWQGSTPYGFKLENGRLVINEEEKEILNQAYDEVLAGSSFHAVERKYMRMGIDWYPDFLIKKLRLASTMGHIKRNGEIYKDKHPPLLTKDKYQKLMERTKGTIRSSEKLKGDLFRQKIICPQCSNKLSVSRYKRANKKYVFRYSCHHCHRAGNPTLSVNEDIVFRAFIDYMQKYTITIKEEDLKAGEKDEKKKITRLNKRLTELKNERDRIQRAWIKSLINDDDLINYQEEIEKEEEEIKKTLNELNAPSRQISDDYVREIKATIAEHFEYMTRKEQAEFIQLHIKGVYIKRKKIHARSYDTSVTKVLFL